MNFFVPGCRQSRKRGVLVVDTTTHRTMQAGAHVASTGSTRGDSNMLYSSIQAIITVYKLHCSINGKEFLDTNLGAEKSHC